MAQSKFKRFMIPGAMVIGGVTAGSMLAPVALAAADDETENIENTENTENNDAVDQPTEADSSAEDEAVSERRGHRGHGRHLGRQIATGIVTETLGMTAEELRAAFEEGKSLADIAAEQGVPVEDVKAALTAEASEHIDRAVADERIDADRAAELNEGLSERIDELVNRTPGEGEGRHKGPGGNKGDRAEALAEFLGLTTEDLRAGFDDGQTLAQVAEAQGVSEDDLVAFLLGQVEERLDEAVENGRIDADDAEEKMAEAPERLEERINAEPGERRSRSGRRP